MLGRNLQAQEFTSSRMARKYLIILLLAICTLQISRENLFKRTKEIIGIQEAFICYTKNENVIEDMRELLMEMNEQLSPTENTQQINQVQIVAKQINWMKKQAEYVKSVLGGSDMSNTIANKIAESNRSNYWQNYKDVLLDVVSEYLYDCHTSPEETRTSGGENSTETEREYIPTEPAPHSNKQMVKTVLIILAPVAVVLIVAAVSFKAFKQRFRNIQRKQSAPVVNTTPAPNPDEKPKILHQGLNKSSLSFDLNGCQTLKTTKEDDEPNFYIYKNVPNKEEDASYYEDPYSMDKQKSSSTADTVDDPSTSHLYSTISNSNKGVVDIESAYHVLSKKKTKPQISVCLEERESNEYTNYKKDTNDNKADTEEELLYEDLDEINYMRSKQFETDKREVQRREITVGWKDQGYSTNLEITRHVAGQEKATSPVNKRYSTGLDLQRNSMSLRSCASPSTQQYSTQLDTNKMLFRQSSSPVHSANPAEQDEDPYQIPEEVLATKQNEGIYINNVPPEQGLD